VVEEEATAGGRIFVGMDVLCAGEGGKGALRALRPGGLSGSLGAFRGGRQTLQVVPCRRLNLGQPA